MTVKVKVGAGHIPDGIRTWHRFGAGAHRQTLHLFLAAVHQQLHNLAVAGVLAQLNTEAWVARNGITPHCRGLLRLGGWLCNQEECRYEHLSQKQNSYAPHVSYALTASACLARREAYSGNASHNSSTSRRIRASRFLSA